SVQGGGSARIDPGGSLNLVVAAVDSDCDPADSLRIEFDVDSIPLSGGHNHDGNTPNGVVNPDTGWTDEDGRLTTTFSGPVDTCGPPECTGIIVQGIAGKYIVWARSSDTPGNPWDSLHIESRVVPPLGALEEGDHWNLVGETPEHPDNHYGTASANQHLRDIGWEFDSTLEARGQLIPPGGLVNYNDQSLIWGGLFDIGGSYGSLWHCPHCLHHDGTHCDIVKFCDIYRDTLLERIIEDHGTIIHDIDCPDPRAHWHAQF
ncbi:MAG: hypothetical protein ACE5JA_06850, partial [bacterium]